MSNRILQINSEIQKAISEILTYDIKNPNITGIITVTRVDTTADLETSDVYVSIFTPDDKMEVFNQILHSARYIRKEVCARVKLRKAPYFTFKLDDSIEYSDKINSVINEIERTRKDDNE